MATKKILMREYYHPNWDMFLIVPADGGEKIALDHLGEDGGDPALFVTKDHWMTQKQIDALPEFDG